MVRMDRNQSTIQNHVSTLLFRGVAGPTQLRAERIKLLVWSYYKQFTNYLKHLVILSCVKSAVNLITID